LEADVPTLIPCLGPPKKDSESVALSYFTATSTRETIPTLIAHHSAQRQYTQARVLILYL
jgi:hypothetical protein